MTRTRNSAPTGRKHEDFHHGFTKKSAETFFTRLKDAEVKRVVDVRLNNVSQLAGFAKKEDLRFFARAICDADYVHAEDLAPTREMLDTYKKKKGDWKAYEKEFLTLIRERRVEKSAKEEVVDGSCLLCSEETPEHCHRRLVAEYLQEKWKDVAIEHLL
jgi:uncharacterized protein (DUF488 family)